MVIDELIVIENGEQKFVDSADNKVIDVIAYNSGKNLFNSNDWAEPITQLGVDIQYLKDEDCFLLNGTATGSTTFGLKYINLPVVINSYCSVTTKYVSGTITRPNGTEYAVVYFGKNNEPNKSTNWCDVSLREYDNKKDNNIIDTNYITAFWFYIQTGVSFDNYKVKIQLEKGSVSTDYEPYGGADYHFARENEVTDGVCENAVSEPIIDLQVSGNSVYESVNLFDKNNVLSGFLPTSGAYPTTSSSHPDATYQIIDIKEGQTFRITYTGTNAQNGRIRYIDNDANEVVGMIEKTTSTGNGYYITNVSQNNGFKDGEITALKDFKLGVLYLYAMSSDFNLQIISTVPNPSMPLEIVSVGDKTNNLIDISSIANDYCTVVNGALEVRIISGNSSSGCGKTLKQLCPDIEAGKTYTLSFVTDSDYSSAISIGAFGTNANRWESGKQRTISEVDLETNVRFGEFGTGSRIVTFSNIQITEDATGVYEPYGKYKVPIKIHGKNLLPYPYYVGDSGTLNDISWKVNEDKSITLNGTASANATINLIHSNHPIAFKVGTYTISGNNIQNSGIKLWFREVGSGTVLISTYNGNAGKLTLTKDSNMYVYISISAGTTLENVTIYPLLEQGSVATAYEPYIEPTITNIYLSEPLRKVGDYADYIDCKNKKVIRNIVEYIFNGNDVYNNEAWGYLSKTTAGLNVYGLVMPQLYDGEGLTSMGPLLCSHYKTTTINSNFVLSETPLACVRYSTWRNLEFAVLPEEFPDIEDWKTFLREQYNAGTPLSIVAVLKESTEEAIGIPEISTADGTNIFDIATTIEPSELKVGYWKQIMPDEVNNV